MSSEELNKMSQKIPSQGSPYDTDASSGEIEWKLEDLQKAIIDSAEMYDELLDKAGQHDLPPKVAEDMWEMERKLWSQREGKELDDPSF